MLEIRKFWLIGSAALLLSAAGCGDDDSGTTPNPDAGGEAGRGGSGGGGSGSSGGGTGGGAADSGASQSLCDKYGGADVVEGVIKDHVVPAIAGDCRVNTFFVTLPEARLTRVADCLAIQAQELFGCEGISYAGSEASNGLPCRSMTEAHAGLGLTKGDFDALIEDVVAGLMQAGVDEADINAAAPALLGLQGAIVEDEDAEDPSQAMCTQDAGMEDGG